MNTEIEQYERIQAYLRGNMSTEDRIAFERDLATDDALRQQYNDLSIFARAIQKANQEVDLRMALEETEQKIAEAADVSLNNSALEAELDQVERELRMMGVSVDEPQENVIQKLKKHIARFFNALVQWFTPTQIVPVQSTSGSTIAFSLSYVSRMSISAAVTAALALAIILPTTIGLAISGFNYPPERIELSVFRGDSSNLLEKAVDCYNNKDYDAAFSYLDKTKRDLESTLLKLGESDSDMIAKQALTNELYQIEWYRALSLMKRKRVKEAKRALSAISETESPFAKEATKVLKNVY